MIIHSAGIENALIYSYVAISYVLANDRTYIKMQQYKLIRSPFCGLVDTSIIAQRPDLAGLSRS